MRTLKHCNHSTGKQMLQFYSIRNINIAYDFIKQSMLKGKILLLFLTFVLLLLSENNSFAATINVSGVISTDTTWIAGNTYIVTGAVSVSSGVTLIIQQNVTVKFNDGFGLGVSGILDAQGTSGNLIYFTDIRDDTVGGDTNGDGDDTIPVPGGWTGISVGNGGSANLTYMEMRYAGRIKFTYKSNWTYCSLKKTGDSGSIITDHFTLKDISNHGIFIHDSTAAHSFSNSTFDSIGTSSFFLENVADITVQNSIIQNSGGRGIYLINSSGSLSDNIFQNNSQYGVYIAGSSYPSTFTNNTFSSNTSGDLYLDGNASGMNVGETNTLNAIIVGGTLSVDATWQSPSTYLINTFTVGSGTTLAIGAGRVVKFNSGSMSIAGTIEAQGASGDLIYFTDIRDDSVGGDTNGDGNTTTPEPSGWAGLSLADGGSANLTYMEMRYAGRIKFIYKSTWTYCSLKKTGNSGSIITDHFTLKDISNNGIFIYDSTAAHSFSNSTFDSNGASSFFLENVADITVQNSIIQNSGGRGIYLINSSGSLSDNTIQNNSQYGIYISGALSTPVIKNNIIKNNLTGIYTKSSANPIIGGSTPNANDIYGNTDYGVYNADNDVTVIATHNWWGDTSGPYQATTNPAAIGDWVSDFVDYGNFATLPVNETIAIITVTPASHDYGSVAIGLAESLTFTVHNSGNTLLHINSITFSGDNEDFSSINDNCTGRDVASSGECTFDLVFTPVALGGKITTCTINSTDPNTPNKDISLLGTGTNPVLSVNKTGNGSGVVTSGSPGIDCGDDCSEVYAKDTQVTLSAAPQTGTVFNGWSGGGCSGTGNCVVDMSQSFTVMADFSLDTFLIEVNSTGTGTGIVTSDLAGIYCGSDCSQIYNYATPLTLTSAPDIGSTFAGWSGGGCSGTAPCTFSVEQARTITATFDHDGTSQKLNVVTNGTGFGTVISTVPGIDCGSDCSETYLTHTSVELTATAIQDCSFAGWSGGGCSGSGSCFLFMDQDESITATFDLNLYALMVFKTGKGTGAVLSDMNGIDCGDDCSETYTENDIVTLTVTSDQGSRFNGWSGACVGGDTCVITLDQAKTVTADFGRSFSWTLFLPAIINKSGR